VVAANQVKGGGTHREKKPPKKTTKNHKRKTARPGKITTVGSGRKRGGGRGDWDEMEKKFLWLGECLLKNSSKTREGPPKVVGGEGKLN